MQVYMQEDYMSVHMTSVRAQLKEKYFGAYEPKMYPYWPKKLIV